METFSHSIGDAREFEHKHVKDVYEKIACEFSKTRYKVWDNVKEFIDKIPTNSNLIEIGCGNGKNLYRSDITSIGIDNCVEFLNICDLKGLNVKNMDCCDLCFDDNTFDNAISIAVFHHLTSSERRMQAFEEMIRILKPGGRGLVTLWSMENQIKQTFDEGDNLVTWNHKGTGIIFERYYFVFSERLLNEFIQLFRKKIKVKQTYNDKGNWYVEFEKTSSHIIDVE